MAAELRDIKDREHNQDLIDTLRNLLERAEAGRIRSVVAVAGWDNGATNTSWTLDRRSNRETLIGALAIAQYELTTNTCLERDDTILSQALYE